VAGEAASTAAALGGLAAGAAARATPVDSALPLPAAPAAPRPDAGSAQALPTTPAAAPAPAAVAAAAPAVEGAADGADATPATTSAGLHAASSQPTATRGGDSVVLAGPPTAWRQTLHEALGERLQTQIGNNAQQATIRLEPPMLGRIEISIRHSGGNLEVHIAASNSEVLRQLNTVSDSLRNDLAGRQYSNVSVNVGETPRAQATAQAGNQPSGQPGADTGGRGRQQEQEDGKAQRAPGLALHDAGEAGSLFSMNTRD
jgi:flagellar hook-length control protein FliK